MLEQQHKFSGGHDHHEETHGHDEEEGHTHGEDDINLEFM